MGKGILISGKSKRIAKACAEVLRISEKEEITIVKACLRAKVSRRTFYAWLAKNRPAEVPDSSDSTTPAPESSAPQTNPTTIQL